MFVSQLSGKLIEGPIASKWVMSELRNVVNAISICSAYLRSEALEIIYEGDKLVQNSRILTRWRLQDLLSGASDLKAFKVARSLGFSFHIRQDFHGKVFSVPSKGILVGSANATLSGLALRENPNTEICTLVPFSNENHALIDQIYKGSVEVSDALYLEIENHVAQVKDGRSENTEWPESLLNKLRMPEFSGRLLISECLHSRPTVSEDGKIIDLDDHDRELLGLLPQTVNIVSLERAFKSTRVYRWIMKQLEAHNDELYFGKLTEFLHNTLLDDPKVYRREVKQLLSNLLHWCELCTTVGVAIDRPNHSQRIRRVSSN